MQPASAVRVHSEASTSDLVEIIGKRYPSYGIVEKMVRWPTLFMLLSYMFFIIVTLLYVTDERIKTVGSIGSLANAGPAATSLDAVNSVLEDWESDYSSLIRKSFFGYNVPKVTLFVVYHVRSGFWKPSSVFDDAVIKFIANLEHVIYSSEEFRESCWTGKRPGNALDAPGCTPINSLAQYFFPGRLDTSRIPYTWECNGAYSSGPQKPTRSVTDFIKKNPNWKFYAHFKSDDTTQADMMRSAIHLKASGGSKDPALGAEERIAQLIEEHMNQYRAEAEKLGIYISLGGGNVYELRIRSLLPRDTIIVFCVFIIIYFPWAIHVHSKTLGLFAILHLIVIYPVGIAVFSWATGKKELSIFNVLSLFTVLASAVQGQTVFFSTFVQSGFMPTTGVKNTLSVAQRLSFTYRKAGIGISASAAVGLACFIVLSTVSVPAVAQFGQLMTAMTCISWIMLLTTFPSAVLVHHFYISGGRRNAQKQKEIVVRRSTRSRRSIISHSFHMEVDKLRQQYVSCWMLARNSGRKLEMDHYLPPSAMCHAGVGAMSSFQALDEYMTAEMKKEMAEAESGVKVSRQMRGVLGMYKDDKRLADSIVTGPPQPAHSFQNNNEEAQTILDDFDRATSTRASSLKLLDERLVVHVHNVACDIYNQESTDTARQYLRDSMVTSVFDMDGEHAAVVAHHFGVVPHASSATIDAEQTGTEKGLRFVDVTQIQHGTEGVAPAFGQLLKESIRLTTFTKQIMYIVFGVAACIGPVQRKPRVEVRPPQPRPANAGPAKVGFARWMEELRANPRSYIFFGKRTNENEGDRKRRILTLPSKREGFSRLERWLFDVYAPMISKLRYGIVVASVVLIALAAWGASTLVASTTPLTFLPATDPIGRYPADEKMFSGGSCYLCSPYFAFSSSFPFRPSRSARVACNRTYGIDMMFATIDSCGVCNGDGGSCPFCNPSDELKTLDNCSQCLQSTDYRFNYCDSCAELHHSKSTRCGPCQTESKFPDGYSGPQCHIICDDDTCPPGQGQCNQRTGACECHNDPQRGYFTGAQCERCSDPNSKFPWCDKCVGSQCLIVCDKRHTRLAGKNSCTCHDGYGGTTCGFLIECNNRSATIYNGICGCIGQFFGPQCELCRCFNGGTCSEYGVCECLGSWVGHDCSMCNQSLLKHGSCPETWRPERYPTIALCEQAFCNADEINFTGFRAEGAIVSPQCMACEYAGTDVPFDTTGCQGEPCDTFSQCKGQWSGLQCDVCGNGLSGVTCNNDGVMLGCDGVESNDELEVKQINACGVCGGADNCFGCDGVPFSKQLLTSCGTCTDEKYCEGTDSQSVITLTWGISPSGGTNPNWSLNDTRTQAALNYFMWFLREDSATFTDRRQSSFPFLDFVKLVLAVGLNFPVIPPDDINSMIDVFSENSGRSVSFGFTSGSRDEFGETRKKLTYVSATMRSPGLRDSSPLSELRAFRNKYNAAIERAMEAVRASSYNDADPQLYRPLMTSPAWSLLEAQDTIIKGMIRSILIGAVMFYSCCLIVSRSLVVATLCIVALSSNILCVLAFFSLIGWNLGPTELVSVSIVIGTGSGQLVHLAESFAETLHATQSHLLAKVESRGAALQTTLQRHGTAFLIAYTTVILGSILPLFCTITVLHTIAITLIVCTALNFVHTMVILPGLFAAFAPTQISTRATIKFLIVALGVSIFIVGCVIIALEF